MNEFLTQARTRFSAVASATAGFYRRNTTILLGGLAIFCVLLVVWARLGFTFEIGRFFAAGTCPDAGRMICQDGDVYELQENPSGYGCVTTLVEDCGVGTCRADAGGAVCIPPEATPIPTPTSAPTGTPITSPISTGAGVCPCGDGSWGENGVTVCKTAGNIDTSQRCTMLAPGSRASVTVTICNNSAETIYSKEALFFSPMQTCGAHDQNPGHSSVSGPTSLAPGAIGQVTYAFNVDSCGSWQLDDTWGPGNFVFVVGQVVNTGVSCVTSTPVPSTSTTPTPSAPVSPTPTGSTTPTPATSVAPSPSISPTLPPGFTCEPNSQSVRRNVYATIRAVSGTGILSWATPDAQRRDGTCADKTSCDVRYSRRGTYEVTVTESIGEGQSRSAVCVVRVIGGGGGGGAGGPDLDVVKVVRNFPLGDEHKTVAAAPGSAVEFIVTVFNDGSVTANDVIVRDTLPDRLAYIPGSTTVGGSPAADGLTTGGLSIGNISAGESVVIRFRATVAPAVRFTTLTTILTNIAAAQGSNTNEASDNANVEVQKIATITQVKTGPGETLLAAVLVAGVMTLLYVSYTRTSTYRRREVEHISEQRDPLDFRN